ncbi:MAG: hypothetical protein CMA56_01060 [Euryarchaeota archaeon]|nr:hypothetical protein [Euryarchaeota archaeon]
MGRSVPTWRVRVDQELQALDPYRRLLPHDEQVVFDDLLAHLRQRRGVAGMLPAHDPWTPLLLTALLEAWVRLRSLEDALEGRDAA